MSTFSTKGGLYERAARRFGLADGMRLFSYAFFDKQRLEALASQNLLKIARGPIALQTVRGGPDAAAGAVCTVVFPV